GASAGAAEQPPAGRGGAGARARVHAAAGARAGALPVGGADGERGGAPASILLEVDEAQDVPEEKYDRDFAPMAASTNAVRVFYGTAGRDDDLLQRIKAANLEAAQRDGAQRHFEYAWWVIAEHNRAYGEFVESERERLGATHPTFQSQYELKPV